MSNEITAYFKGTSGVSESVYQFDYGMIMIIDGPDLTAPFEVHFEHTGGVDAVTAIGQDNRVAIPNACLALPGRVTAYIYDHTGQHDGQTAYVVRFQVMNRARPVDEVTDEQDSAISKAIALLAEPIDNIETIVNEALAKTGTTLTQLEAQFDAAVHAVTTDTEVTDIRVGADGVTDTTAGASVRRQFTALKSNLNNIGAPILKPSLMDLSNYADAFSGFSIVSDDVIPSGAMLHAVKFYSTQAGANGIIYLIRDADDVCAELYSVSYQSGWNTIVFDYLCDADVRIGFADLKLNYKSGGSVTNGTQFCSNGINKISPYTPIKGQAVTISSQYSGKFAFPIQWEVISNYIARFENNVSEMESVKSGYDYCAKITLNDVETEIGYWTAYATKEASPNRLRSVNAIPLGKGDFVINNNNGFMLAVIFCKPDGSSITDSTWIKAGSSFVAPYDGYARISVRKSAESALTSEEILVINDSITICTKYFEKVGFDKIETLNDAINLNQRGEARFDRANFVAGSLSGGSLTSSNIRIASESIMKFDHAILIKADSGYRFGIHLFDSTSAFISDLGWQTACAIPANQRFKMVVAWQAESGVPVVVGIPELLLNHITYTTSVNNILDSAYLYSTLIGEPINTRIQKYNIALMGGINSRNPSNKSIQDCAYSNGVIFQLYASDEIDLIDMAEGSAIATLSITSGHGDVIDFSGEYYDASDEFPLAYITADTNPATVYVNRITRESTSLVRTLVFPLEKTGYYAGHSLDINNNVLYQVGYSEDSYNSNPNNTNRMIVSSWDLDTLTNNGDGTYTPRFIESYTLPFMTTVQGQTFFDNKIIAISSAPSSANTKIYFIDVTIKRITAIMDDFPTAINNVETEGVAFFRDNDRYAMLIKPYSANYYRADFN